MRACQRASIEVDDQASQATDIAPRPLVDSKQQSSQVGAEVSVCFAT